MEIYLARHGTAKTESEDSERPLTERGKEEVAAVARKLAKAGVTPAEILHSPKLRAKQTADIFATHLHASPAEMEGLKPDDEPSIAAHRIATGAPGKNIMLVGHLPHLARLASLLLANEPDGEFLKLRTGAVACLVKEENWKIRWILTPELV